MPNLRLLAKPIKKKLLQQGILLKSATPSAQIKSVLQQLKPIDSGIELVRVGGNSDGGYLIPDDLEGISVCYSPGVFDTALFEGELEAEYAIKSHLADYSVNGAPGGFVPKTFLKKYVGSFSNDVYITLSDWIAATEHQDSSAEYLLQMDIEGGEYETIISTPSDVLRRFRIIVMEIHGFNNWSEPAYFNLVEKFFKKMLMDFAVVHLHANNCCGTSLISGIDFPNVFEITLIRKDRVRSLKNQFSKLPHPLDRKNVPGKGELQIVDSLINL
jgi:hypothetical protein